jgi:hypothetical protein
MAKCSYEAEWAIKNLFPVGTTMQHHLLLLQKPKCDLKKACVLKRERERLGECNRDSVHENVREGEKGYACECVNDKGISMPSP